MRQKNKLWTQPLDGEKREDHLGSLWQQGTCPGRCRKQTGAQQGRSQEEPIPPPLPRGAWRPHQQRLPGAVPGTGSKAPASVHVLSSPALPLSAPRAGRAGGTCTEPTGSVGKATAAASDPANPELFQHGKEGRCCCKRVPKGGRKFHLFLFEGSLPRAQTVPAKRRAARLGLRKVVRCIQAAQCCLLTKPLSRAYVEIQAVPTPFAFSERSPCS